MENKTETRNLSSMTTKEMHTYHVHRTWSELAGCAERKCTQRNSAHWFLHACMHSACKQRGQFRGHVWSKAMATSNPPSSLKVTQVWPLEKYARFIPVEEQGQALPQKESIQKKAGNWKVSLCRPINVELVQLFQYSYACWGTVFGLHMCCDFFSYVRMCCDVLFFFYLYFSITSLRERAAYRWVCWSRITSWYPLGHKSMYETPCIIVKNIKLMWIVDAGELLIVEQSKVDKGSNERGQYFIHL